jgi:hypothetical protein
MSDVFAGLTNVFIRNKVWLQFIQRRRCMVKSRRVAAEEERHVEDDQAGNVLGGMLGDAAGSIS